MPAVNDIGKHKVLFYSHCFCLALVAFICLLFPFQEPTLINQAVDRAVAVNLNNTSAINSFTIQMTHLFVVQHLDRETPGLFQDLAQQHGMAVHVIRVDLGEPLPSLVKGDGLLVLGGPMGVADLHNPAFPWLEDEVLLIQQALELQIPFVGVCLGAQLLAHAAGGGVEPLLGGDPPRPLAEVGWAPITSTLEAANQSLITSLMQPLDVLHWHGDRIILPETANVLACSVRCREQLFRIGPLAYGLQFHLEVEDEDVFRWIAEDNDFICAALGENAADILRDQQRLYSSSSRPRRLKLLADLFRELWPSHF